MSNLLYAINSSQTTIFLINTDSLPQSGVVMIESEEVFYASATDNQLLGCIRGFNSTSAATHAIGLAVTLVATNIFTVPNATNVTTTQLIALTPSLGAIVFNTTTAHFLGWNGTSWAQLDN
jgi:hypothetical protein